MAKRNNYLLKFFLIIIFAFIASCELSETTAQNSYYKVTRIIDGDTFVVDDGTKKGIKIRLIGIDAPETRNTGKKQKGYYGNEAKQFLSSLIENKIILLEYDVEKTDRYNRTLAYAYLTDGTFINAELVKNGYAQIATFPPNVKYVELFLNLQQEAKKDERGLWGEKE
jgi:micrococcal nuclease